MAAGNAVKLRGFMLFQYLIKKEKKTKMAAITLENGAKILTYAPPPTVSVHPTFRVDPWP
jgi:hypothetical protein